MTFPDHMHLPPHNVPYIIYYPPSLQTSLSSTSSIADTQPILLGESLTTAREEVRHMIESLGRSEVANNFSLEKTKVDEKLKSLSSQLEETIQLLRTETEQSHQYITANAQGLVSVLFFNLFSALLRRLWSATLDSRIAILSPSIVRIESGYDIETVFDGLSMELSCSRSKSCREGSFWYWIPRTVTSTRPKLVAGSAKGWSGHVDGKPREARMNHPTWLTVDSKGVLLEEVIRTREMVHRFPALSLSTVRGQSTCRSRPVLQDVKHAQGSGSRELKANSLYPDKGEEKKIRLCGFEFDPNWDGESGNKEDGQVKILKKYDKRSTGALIRQPFIEKVLQQPFFTTDLLYKLVKECVAMLDHLFPSNNLSISAECDRQNGVPKPAQSGGRVPELEEIKYMQSLYMKSTVAALRSLKQIRSKSSTVKTD
ncbi:hypothetical protein ZIOFF_060350 [Zingiber officinale]|uniref:Uncharacterized protein n=1 Tax=Zingiber officinale TaxID=94328 RepID=A0A8J5FCK7_ZINOF|nr:hypothetical protein ZIOFF_060350 [Zingiber officinale]